MLLSTPHDFCEMALRSLGVSWPAPGIWRSMMNLGMVFSWLMARLRRVGVSETERGRTGLDQLVHRAGTLDAHALHEALLRVAARLDAGRAGPHRAAARHEVVEELLERVERRHVRHVGALLAHQVHSAA